MRRFKIFAGERLRRLRSRHGMRQAALARELGLSPSYLSQIEADERPLPASVIERLAARFGVPESHFADADDAGLASSLREATRDPLFGGLVSAEEAEAAVRAAPGVVHGLLAVYRSYLALEEQHTVLRGRVLDDAPPRNARFPYDEVRDWVQSRRNHFDAIDRAAEALAARLGPGGAAPGETLTRYLRDAHGIAVDTDPTLLSQGTVWRLQRGARRLLLAESASAASRSFWMAHIVGRLEQRAMFEREVRSAGLSSGEARALARISLANYYAGAVLMPYGTFLAAARELRYDIERLQSRFGASFEQVCHRLSTMQRPGRPGVPFYFVKTDIAGNVLKRSSATRFQFARFGGPCPLWNVYRSFAQPGQVLVQVARTPDDVTYLNVARTVGQGGGSYLSRPRSVAVVLGCEAAHAAETVYAAGLDLQSPEKADPIGPGCRACERVECRHRAVPPLGRALDVGTAERGVVPYRIGTAPEEEPSGRP